MTIILICALLLAAIVIAFLACILLVQSEEMDSLRREYECEHTWADEYCRQADAADAALDSLRRDYAALLAAHQRSAAAVFRSAWRAGLSGPRRLK